MARQRINHTPKVIEAIKENGGEIDFNGLREALHLTNEPTWRAANVAVEAGLVERVKTDGRKTLYLLTDTDKRQDDLDEEVTSARDAILKILDEQGEMEDDKALAAAMNKISDRWRSLGLHSLDHQLFSMEKAGLIEMDKTRAGRVQRLSRIRLPKRQVFVLPPTASGPAPAPMYEAFGLPVPEELKPEGERYPILDSLRAKESALSETNRRIDAYMAAASALESVDAPESERLLRLAESLGDTHLSSVEAEYLRWVRDHEKEAK